MKFFVYWILRIKNFNIKYLYFITKKIVKILTVK